MPQVKDEWTTIETTKSTLTSKLNDVLESCSYLVAALHDPDHGPGRAALSREVRDALDTATATLREHGYIGNTYTRADGRITV